MPISMEVSLMGLLPPERKHEHSAACKTELAYRKIQIYCSRSDFPDFSIIILNKVTAEYLFVFNCELLTV